MVFSYHGKLPMSSSREWCQHEGDTVEGTALETSD